MIQIVSKISPREEVKLNPKRGHHTSSAQVSEHRNRFAASKIIRSVSKESSINNRSGSIKRASIVDTRRSQGVRESDYDERSKGKRDTGQNVERIAKEKERMSRT